MKGIVKGGVGSLAVHAAAFGGLLFWKPGGDDHLVVIDLTLMPAAEMADGPPAEDSGSPASPTVPAAAPNSPRARAPSRAVAVARRAAQVRPAEVTSALTDTTGARTDVAPEPAAAAAGATEAVTAAPPGTPDPSGARGTAGARGSPGGTGTGAGNAQQVYLATHFTYIREAIQRAAAYPPLARRLGWIGRVLLRFRILPDGAVANVRVVKASGFDVLDAGAIEAVRRASPFPRPPVEAELVVPVAFSLE